MDCILKDCFNGKPTTTTSLSLNENEVKQCTRRYQNQLPKPFDDVWEKLVLSSLELKQSSFEKCYDYHNEAMAVFIKDFKAREEPEDVIWTIKSDEANDERFSIVRGKSGRALEKSWEKSDEVGNVRGRNSCKPIDVRRKRRRGRRSWRS